MAQAPRDENRIPALLGTSNSDNQTTVRVWVDPTTHRLLVDTGSSGGGGGTSMVDDAAFTVGTTEGTPAFGFFNDVAPDSVDEGDAGALRMAANRVLYTQIRDGAGNERGATVNASGQLAISGPVTNAGTFAVQAAQSGTWNVATVTTVTTVSTVTTVTTLGSISTSITPGTSAAHLGKAEDAAHSSGDTGVAAWGVANEAQSTFGADGDYAPQATDTKGNRLVVGNVAHDAVDAGNPVKVGGVAITALPTAVAASDRANAVTDKFGRQITLPVTVRDLVGTQTTTISASTTETTIVTAASSVFNDLVMLIISNTSASTNTRIDFRDTTGGTVLFSLQSNGGQPPIGFALPVPIPQTSVNTNWTAQCATSTTDVRIYAVFAKNR